MSKHILPIRDQDILYRERFEAQLKDRLRILITPEIVEEHRRKPLGQHSDALERLLLYLRMSPGENKYVLFELEPDRAFKIVATSGKRDVAPRDVDGQVFGSETEALHAVFLMRLRQTFGYEDQ